MKLSARDLGVDISGRVQQRMQLHHLQHSLDASRKPQCLLDPRGRDTGQPNKLLSAHDTSQLRIGCPLAHRDREPKKQQMHLHTDLVGNAHQRRMRERTEVQIR
ncbi:Uncharacterised protein [Mycobacteroides abscessus subsp. abscessus]|nr:Uncharacterised protein [Mycobacteroides abscessus subsp. abscessus]